MGASEPSLSLPLSPARPGLTFLLKINQTVRLLEQLYQHALRGATYSTQQCSAGASLRRNDTCTPPPPHPPAASADTAATDGQQAGGN